MCLKTKAIDFAQSEECISNFTSKMILLAVIIQLYCFKLSFQKHCCLKKRIFFNNIQLLLILVVVAMQFEIKQNSFTELYQLAKFQTN